MKRDASTLSAVFIALATVTILQVRLYAQSDHTQKPDSSADTTANAYNLLIASGFLCDPPNPDFCPAVARDSNGDSIAISGAGTIAPGSRSVVAAGAFTEKAANGSIVTNGVWSAMELVSFVSYGLAPGELQRDYPEFNAPGPPPLGKMPAPVASLIAGRIAAGGLAVIRVRLVPDAGSPKDAVLQIKCAKGKVPDGAENDGIRLTVAGGPMFDEQVSGRTALLLQRPGSVGSWK